ncbi:MAG: hypothetical protein ACFFD2_09250 [Promethearchaeota archaeon]
MNVKKEKERILRIAYEALNECNKLHESTGRIKIPLDEVAENLAITKEEIQESFDQLVQEGDIISDDGDRNHMNYSGELLELIQQLLLKYLKQKNEGDIEENEEEIISYIY